MRLIKKNGVYQARFRTLHGKSKTVTTRCTDRTEAVKVVNESGLKDLELAAKAGRLTREAIGHIVTGRKLTLAKALVEYEHYMTSRGKSPRTIANNLLYLRSWMTHAQAETLPPSAITQQMISGWVNNPDSETKAATRAVMLAAVRSFCFFCTAKGWMPTDPSRLVGVDYRMLSHAQKESTVRKVFSPEEYQRLLADSTGFWQFAIRASRELGLRLGDICQLEWDCFATPDQIIVWTDKRDRRIAVPISAELAEVVTLIAVNHPKHVFPEQRELMLSPTRRALLSVQFTRACAKLGISGKSFHCLRHTFATTAKASGKSLEQIAQEMGHTNTKTTEGYVHNA